ncbi:MAG: hypothetical protein ACE5JU_01670 [Candidatus Binatia bacterium]
MAGPSVASLPRSLEATVDLLRQARIPYMVIDALAVAIWGWPRTTLDVDIVVFTNQPGLRRLTSQASKKRPPTPVRAPKGSCRPFSGLPTRDARQQRLSYETYGRF